MKKTIIFLILLTVLVITSGCSISLSNNEKKYEDCISACRKISTSKSGSGVGVYWGDTDRECGKICVEKYK